MSLPASSAIAFTGGSSVVFLGKLRRTSSIFVHECAPTPHPQPPLQMSLLVVWIPTPVASLGVSALLYWPPLPLRSLKALPQPDVIRRMKEGRTIVLTTHYMDEADLLGDRIAIMSQGELQCFGSSLFLKNRYGVGYNLTIVKAPEHNDATQGPALSGLVTKHVPDAKVLTEVGAELSFMLPSSANAHFQALLGDLDAQSEDLCVSSYGLTSTTLEDVFLRVAEGTADVEDRQRLAALRTMRSSFEEADASASAATPEGKKLGGGGALLSQSGSASHRTRPVIKSGSQRFRDHTRALIIKRAAIFRREKKTVCFTLFAPTMFLLLGLIILLASAPLTKQPALVLDPGVYNKGLDPQVGDRLFASFCP